MLLFWYELKKSTGKLWLFVSGCFLLNILGADSISRNLDNAVRSSDLFSRYLPNISLECVITSLLLTHFIIGYEYSSNTEGVVYSAAIGRKSLIYKLAASIAAALIYSIALLGASLAVYFIMRGISTDWSLFAKVLFLSFGLILLFVFIAFTIGTTIRNPWAAAITSVGANVLLTGLVMNFQDLHSLRLQPMGLLMSQKSWFSGVHGKDFELWGFAMSGIALIILCYWAYQIFRRRDI